MAEQRTDRRGEDLKSRLICLCGRRSALPKWGYRRGLLQVIVGNEAASTEFDVR